MMKNKNGITLISLVVTIIILIILAGISINLILGQNGIITKVKEAKTVQKIKEMHEELELQKVELAVEKEGKLILQEYIEKIQNDENMRNKVTRNRKNR